ncbi:unnamed protein product [Closterium sp. NIES-54]
MYAVTDSAEGDCYLSVPPDPRIEAAALGASESAAPGADESALSGTAPTESLHTFTLDSGALRSFFRDSTTLTLLSRPVAVSLADPSRGPVLAHSSTVLTYLTAPSGLLSGLHLPSFSTNLVSGADLQDVWVDQFTPGGQRVTHCTCSRTGRHLATFTRRPGSSLYTLTTTHPPVLASGQVAASSQVFAAASRSSPASDPCACRPLTHETLHDTTALVTSLCLVFEVWPPVLLSLGSPGPSLPFLRGLPPLVFLVSRAGSAPLLTPPRSLQQRSLCRLFTWTCGAQPASIDRVTSATFCWSLTTTRSHFLWPFAVQYAAHHINLQPRVSLPETTPTLRWTGKVGDASAFRVYGSRAFVRDTTADKLSSRAIPCVFLGFPPDAPGWQYYHPTSCRVLSSQDITFDESVSYYRLFPYRPPPPPPPPPLFLTPGTPPVHPLPPQGPAPSGVSQVDPAEPVEVAFDSNAESGGAEPAGEGTGGAESGGAEFGRAEPGGAEPGRVEPEGFVSGGAEPACAASGGALGVPPRREPFSPQQLREWYSRRCRSAARASGGTAGAEGVAGASGGAAGTSTAGGAARASGGAAGAGAAGAGAAGGAAGASGGAAGAGAAGGAIGTGTAGGARGATGAGAAGGTAGAGAAGGAAGTGDPGAEGPGSVSAVSGGAVRPRPYYVLLLQQVLGSPPSLGPPPPFLSPPPVQSQSQIQPASPLPGPSPYSGLTRGLTERREPESRPVSPVSRSASPVRPVRAVCVSRPRPPPVPGTQSMTLRPSTAPQRVPLPSPPASFLPAGPDPESDSLRTASPAVAHFLATAVTDPLFYLVPKSASASVCPPSVGGECALSTDILEDRREEFECFAASVPHLVSMLIAPEGDPDAPDIPTPRSYAEAIEGPYSSQWHAAMDVEMASWKSTGTYVDEVPPPGANILDFSTAFLQGSLHEEIWLRRPPGFTRSFPAGTQWSLWRPVYGLRQAPREWHDTLRTTLAALGFAPSTADPSQFLRTDTTLPPFYVLVYVDDLVCATAVTEALAHVKSELQKRHTCTDLGELTSYLGLLITRDRAQRAIALT